MSKMTLKVKLTLEAEEDAPDQPKEWVWEILSEEIQALGVYVSDEDGNEAFWSVAEAELA